MIDNNNKIRSFPKGEFLGTMVVSTTGGAMFIMDKQSKYRLEQENIRRSNDYRNSRIGSKEIHG